MSITEDRSGVSLADLTRRLGIKQNVRQYILAQGLVTPVEPVKRGRTTYITDEDAERLSKAATVAALTGVAVVVALKVINAL